MLYYTVGQGYALAHMMLCGVIMGAIYELFRVLRRLTRAGAAFTALLDGIMCAVMAVVAAVMLLRANGGELRLYALLGCGAGMALFMCGPARLGRAAARRAGIMTRNVCKRLQDISIVRKILK